MLLEVEAQVEERLAQRLPPSQQQNVISSRPRRPLPSRKGWIVSNCTWARRGLDEHRQSCSGSSCRNARARPCSLDHPGGGGTKRALPGRRAADPVLAAAELAGLFVAAASAGQELAVDLPQQPVREREAAAQPLQAVFERGDVVGDLEHVVEGDAGRFVDLEQQQVRERRLRAFDLRGEHGLLADVGVEEELGVGQQSRDAVEPSAGEERPLEQACRGPEGRAAARGQRSRNEGPHRLARRWS